MNHRTAYRYGCAQVDLACLDTMDGEHEDYAACLRFIGESRSAGEAIHQMFVMHSALAFEARERETSDDRYARWAAESAEIEQRRAA